MDICTWIGVITSLKSLKTDVFVSASVCVCLCVDMYAVYGQVVLRFPSRKLSTIDAQKYATIFVNSSLCFAIAFALLLLIVSYIFYTYVYVYIIL